MSPDPHQLAWIQANPDKFEQIVTRLNEPEDSERVLSIVKTIADAPHFWGQLQYFNNLIRATIHARDTMDEFKAQLERAMATLPDEIPTIMAGSLK